MWLKTESWGSFVCFPFPKENRQWGTERKERFLFVCFAFLQSIFPYPKAFWRLDTSSKFIEYNVGPSQNSIVWKLPWDLMGKDSLEAELLHLRSFRMHCSPSPESSCPVPTLAFLPFGPQVYCSRLSWAEEWNVTSNVHLLSQCTLVGPIICL